MPLDWDLRKTLDVRPSAGEAFNCVGFAPSKGRRCLNPINISNRGTASRMLDRMDRSESVADVTKNLKELASLLLCIRNHQSQVETVYNKWQRLVAEEYVRLKQQEEKNRERREILKLKNELAKMRSNATQARDELEEEEEELSTVCYFTKVNAGVTDIRRFQPYQPTLSSTMSALNSRLSIDDPFETQTSPSARPNIFTRPPPQSDARNTAILPDDVPATQNKEPSVAEGKKAAHPFSMPYMPSPPTHEPSSRTEPRIAIAEQLEIGTDTSDDSDTITMSKFAFAFGSKSASTVPAFQFETPTKAKVTQVEAAPASGSQNVPAFSRLFGTSNLPTAPISEARKVPEEPKRIPLQEKAAKPMNVALSNKSGPSTYEFGSQDKALSSALEFEAPLKPHQPHINDSTARPAPFKVTQPEDKNSKTRLTSTQPSNQPEESDLSPPSPANDETNNISARPTTPPPKEESFGYANITPNSTRYTTYLPARQQYGLVTPPETPEMLVRALEKPMGYSGYFRDESPRESGSPVPRVARKPLPASPPPLVDGEGEGRGEVCISCGSRAGLGVDECRCGEEGEDMEVRAGCLARFGLKRLKEKVKGRVPRRKGKDFTLQVPALHSGEGGGSHSSGLYI